MEFLRGTMGFCLLVLAVVTWLSLAVICYSVYGLSECVGLFNRAVLGLIDDDE